MTVLVSIYAAVVGTAALAWQVVTWRRGHRTLAEVSLNIGWVYQPTRQSSAHVRVKNGSDHQITVEQVTIEGTAASGIPSIVAVGGWQGRVISARDGFSDGSYLAEDEFDWSLPVEARVLLASGDWFVSTTTTGPPPAV